MAPSARTTGLSPQHIVDVAHQLISQHGLGGFSMRKLATELDVNPMTIYLRFASKAELLDAVARHGLAGVRLPDLPEGAWDERAVALCCTLRTHLISDRNLLALYATAGRMSGAGLQTVEQGLGLMEELGYEGPDAVEAFRALFWHTVGFTFVDQSFDRFPADGPGSLVDPVDEASHPVFARHLPSFTSVDADDLFAHTTRLLVTGILGNAPRPPEQT